MKRKHKKPKSQQQPTRIGTGTPLSPTTVAGNKIVSPNSSSNSSSASSLSTSNSNSSSLSEQIELVEPRKKLIFKVQLPLPHKVDPTKGHLATGPLYDYETETDLTSVCANALAGAAEGDTTALNFNSSECREHIFETLIDTGMISVMKKYISHRLRFGNWTTTLNEECIEYMKEKGVDNVNVSHMMCDLIPVAKEMVPPEVRTEIRDILKSFSLSHVTLDESVSPFIPEGEDFDMDNNSSCDIELPYEYQPRDTKPNPGNGLIFSQPYPSLSPASSPNAYISMHSPPPPHPHMYSPSHTMMTMQIHSPQSQNYSGGGSESHSPTGPPQTLGGVVLLDRLLDKEIDTNKEPANKEKIVIVIPKDIEKPALLHRESSSIASASSIVKEEIKDHHQHHHHRNRRTGTTEKEDRDRKDKEREEQRLLYQQLSKPTLTTSSPSIAPPTIGVGTSSLRSGDRDRESKKQQHEPIINSHPHPTPSVPIKILTAQSQTLNPNTPLLSIATNPSGNIPGTGGPPTIPLGINSNKKQPKHILNSDNDDDDEDDEELLDI